MITMNTIGNYLEKHLEDKETAQLFAQEELLMDVTESICEVLEKENINRKELARRMKRSKAYISQLLNGGRNLTLRTLADILFALGYKVRFEIIKQGNEKNDDNQSNIVNLFRPPSYKISKPKKIQVREVTAEQKIGNEFVTYNLAA